MNKLINKLKIKLKTKCINKILYIKYMVVIINNFNKNILLYNHNNHHNNHNYQNIKIKIKIISILIIIINNNINHINNIHLKIIPIIKLYHHKQLYYKILNQI